MRRSRWLSLFVLLSLALVPMPVASASARHSVDRIDLPVGWQPEGITTNGKVIYSGSLATGAILKADPRSGRTRVLPHSATGKPAVGLEYDRRRRVIWVAGGPTGEIRAQKASNGKLLRTYTFPTGERFINDLVVTRRAVYATDSLNAVIGVVRLGGRAHKRLPASRTVRTLALSGDYVQQPGFNANGIVASRGRLLVVQTSTGKLFRVSRHTGRAREVDLGEATLLNGDGMEIRRDILYVVRNQFNLVAVVDLNRRLTRGEVVDELTGDVDVPSTVAVVRHHVWVVNARFGGTPDEQAAKGYWLTRLGRHHHSHHHHSHHPHHQH
ncbi:MAG TPA: superoxide dismutase [Nocardioidaceae bacterium]|nr:superoxide dismutase [Nocardioidaceae bacterium]